MLIAILWIYQKLSKNLLRLLGTIKRESLQRNTIPFFIDANKKWINKEKKFKNLKDYVMMEMCL
jgi:hypothetical protein